MAVMGRWRVHVDAVSGALWKHVWRQQIRNDEAVLQLLTYWIHLYDPMTGLMFHAYDESGQSTWADKETKHSAEFWCRAMGWFGMTLIEVLELLPSNHPRRAQLIAQLNQLVKAWSKYQDAKTGLWYQ